MLSYAHAQQAQQQAGWASPIWRPALDPTAKPVLLFVCKWQALCIHAKLIVYCATLYLAGQQQPQPPTRAQLWLPLLPALGYSS